jgi:CheY-like chemotaxis protein/nitrogen-specific signal transduction histidine kinase
LDITEIKAFEQSLIVAREDALEASQAKSKFLANMSHELRTPLNAIIGYAEMLEEEAEMDGLDAYTDDIKRILGAGKHLLSLINDILDLSKIEAGRIELFIEEFSVSEMLDNVISTTDSLIRKNDNEFELECNCGDLIIRSDLTRTRQILYNLLSNAAKFTSNGKVSLICDCEEDAQGDEPPMLRFTIRDSGIGMTKDQLAQLFEEFSQADASITKRFQGTGLGLAISKRLAIMLGGDITVESAEGIGSTFTLRIPSRTNIEDADAIVATADAAKPDAFLPDRSDVGHLILVIDDDANSRELLARHITSIGMQVVTAANGTDGLDRARQLRPSVITLDVFMAGVNGIDVLTQLKNDPELRDIPIVMCTISDERELCLSLGAVGFLEKPINRENLLRTLQRHVSQKSSAPILIVDDVSQNRNIIRSQLKSLPLNFIEAENGMDALKKIEDIDALQCVFLDLMMPEMDGFEFLREFRTFRKWRGVPVFVVTSKDLTKSERVFLAQSSQRVVERGQSSVQDVLEDILREIKNCLNSTS